MAYYIDDRTALENGKIINDSAEVLAPISPSYQYKTVTIGTQTWMAENLKETRFRDGTPIPSIQGLGSATDWTNATVGAYCMYPTEGIVIPLHPLNGEFYGYIYNWEAAANGTADCSDTDYGGLAPEGWHVPTDAEWTTLEDYVDDTEWPNNLCASMLADRKDLWETADTTLIDSSEFGTSGFNVLPAGTRNAFSGEYGGMSEFSYFWSSSELDSSDAWARKLYYYGTDVSRNNYDKLAGFSVRCIKDV